MRYYWGRGVVKLSTRNGSGQPVQLNEVGNASRLEIAIDQQMVDYRENASGFSRKTFSVPGEQTVSLSLTLDDVRRDNWLLATQGTYANDLVLAGTETIYGLNTAPQEYWLTFEGVNLAEERNPVTVEIFKLQFRPVPQLSFISEEFLKFELTADVFYDTLNAASGGYFRITQTTA